MNWHVVADFDGTITLHDVTNAVLDRFADASWRRIEAQWEAGRIGSRECMARQVALIRASVAEFDSFVADASVDPYFVHFVADCRHRRIPVTVVSDGLDRIVTAVLSRIGLGDLPVAANHLVHAGHDRWQLIFPYARDDCRVLSGNCKCAAAKGTSAKGTPAKGASVTAAVRETRTVLIGDGRSDLCAAGAADYVFAKKSLLALCRERGIAHRPFETFEDAARLLADLIDDQTAIQSGVDIEGKTYA